MNESHGNKFASGDAYDRYVGRWSRSVAAEFIAWLAPKPAARWLDVGCGTGALTEAILESCDPLRVVGIDPSEAQVETARTRVSDKRATFAIGDASSIGPEPIYDFVVSGLVVNFISDPVKGVQHMKRSAEVGGTVAAYVWDYAEGMQMMRHYWEAAAQADARARAHDEGSWSALCSPDGLRRLWTQAAIEHVETTPIVVPTRFENFDDLWEPFLGGTGPAPSYNMSLTEAERERVRRLLSERLPRAEDGAIELTARAWAVRGTVTN